MFDFHSETTLLALHPTAARTTTTNGSGIDVRDYIGHGTVLLDAAAGTGTTPTNDVKIQDSADNSAFADLSPTLAFAQLTTVASQQKIAINFDKVRRYIRMVATIAGTTPSYTFSVTALGRKQVV